MISVRQLGKEYKLGAQMHDTLRDQLTALFRGKKKQVEKFWALRDVSFDVEQGDCVGIIGRNGAGKSTLLKILSQITEPTEGEIRIRGRIASLLEVGTGFHPELTGRENTFLNGAILGMTRAEILRKFDEIAAFAEMDSFLDTPVKHYSSGMTTRLAFAVAAHLDPEILIIDEVLAVGDAAFQKKCLGRMSEVARAGRTVLFVSHNMAAVSALCSKGIYLERGKVAATGPIEEVANIYLRDALPGGDGGNQFKRGDVRGTGEVRFTDLQIMALDGSKSVVAGGGLRVRLSYEGNTDNVPARFFVNIYDAQQFRLLSLDSLTGGLPGPFPKNGSLELTLPTNFSLTPGRYSVELAALVNEAGADHVPSAMHFEIQGGDFFGNGRQLFNSAACLLRTQWELNPPTRVS
nr:ABC transporter ATP-binding protein [Chthoniobacter flavus]